MSEVAVLKEAGLPTQFNAAGTYNRQSQIDAIIAHARHMKDWPLLEEAVDK